MAFFDIFRNKKEEAIFYDFISLKAKELYIKEHMIEHAVDLIAKTVAKSEVQVFRGSEKNGDIAETVDDVYYSLNIRPNNNDDGTKFMYNAIRKLLLEGEALIVKLSNNDMYIADTWEVNDSVLKGKTYYNVVVSDDYDNSTTLSGGFKADDAILLSLGESEIKKTLDNFYTDYADMLVAASNGYQQSKNKKYRLTPTQPNIQLQDPDTGKNISMNDYKKAISDGLLDSKSSVSMIGSAFGLEVLGEKVAGTTSNDYQELLKGFGEQTSMAFNIPITVFFGTQTEKSNAINDFITFAVSPIIEIIEDGYNGKLISKESYLKGERIKINTFTMKHFDIMDVATSLDKLFAIGWSHNDLRKILGQPLIKESWADLHHVTKNYMDIERENTKKGGE